MGVRHADAPRGLEVDVHVRAWVDNGADVGGIIAQQILALSHTIGQDLLKTRGHSIVLLRGSNTRQD
jgi:hypothetical protein